MGKDKNKEEINPFAAFTVLKGEFEKPNTENEVEDDVSSGDTTVVEDHDTLDEKSLEAKRLAEGDKKLKEVIEKTTKVKEDTEITEVEDTTVIEEVDETKNTNLFKEFTKTLFDKGVVDFDDSDEDFEESEEGITKIVDKTVQNRINKWVDELPDEYTKFLEFVQNGGKPKDFLDIYYGSHSWEGFSIESEANQKVVIAESLRLSGDTEEDINDMITEWAENGTLEKRAKSALPKVQKHETASKQHIVEITKQKADKEKKEQKEYWDNFKKELYSKEELKGFKLTPKLKDKIWDHLTSIDKRTGKTAYQMKMETDKEASLLFALQSANDFDLSKLEKQVTTKVSKNFSDMLANRTKTSKEKISSGRTDESDETNPFLAFKSIK